MFEVDLKALKAGWYKYHIWQMNTWLADPFQVHVRTGVWRIKPQPYHLVDSPGYGLKGFMSSERLIWR